MSAAAAQAEDEVVEADAAPKKGKKKLIIMVVAALLALALIGGGAAFFLMGKKKPAAGADGEDGAAEATATVSSTEKRKERSKHPPVFVPLDPFTVNLADKESDRFAQIGITLEVRDNKFAEELKAYMPAIRNGILMVLAHKTSQQLLSREGKTALANEIMREAVLPLGIVVSADDAKRGDDEEDAKGHDSESDNPISHVHFSNFIVQ